mmetsp:Transcript_99799/g.316792  ORF Transcript_99799/g.316792 Transcript_99799/m.316792 type:complete len:308 (-) Transcript_99799:16-939(-)
MTRPRAAGWGLRGRGIARLLAALANTAMVLYIYSSHLLRVDREKYRSLRVPLSTRGRHPPLWDCLRLQGWDSALEHLRLFSFSDAMSQNLTVYLLVGAPVAVIFFILEWDRVRWLQSLVLECLPPEQGRRAARWLEAYLCSITLTLAFVLSLARFHLELPKAHYLCAGCAFLCGSLSACIYLAVPVDFSSMAARAGADAGLVEWAPRVQRWVRPSLKLVLGLHVVATLAGIWKAQSLGDERAALTFGVLETAVVLGYQLFLAVFVIDDIMVGCKVVPIQDARRCILGDKKVVPLAIYAEPQEGLTGS